MWAGPDRPRRRNEPEVDPETCLPYSTRNLVTCLQEGMRRFGWTDRNPAPGVRLDQGWLVGTGVAAARSQLIGGMTMGLSMALHEAAVIDPRFGHVVNHDLAS